MDSDIQTAIFSEIDHNVLDSNEKVTINQLSQNWDLSLKQCSELLDKWCKGQKNIDLTQEYIVRGVDKNNNVRITILHKDKLEKAQKIFEKFHSCLFSIEKVSETKSLDINQLSEGKWVNLPLEGKLRVTEQKEDYVCEEDGSSTSKLPTKKMVSPKKEPVTPKINNSSKKGIASMFANVKPKEEKTSPTSPSKNHESKTPQKGKPHKRSPTKGKTNGSTSNSAKMTKKSISSFFDHAPAKKTVEKVELSSPVEVEEKPKITETTEIMIVDEVNEEKEDSLPVKEINSNGIKRSISNESDEEVIEGTPKTELNPSKKFKSQRKKKFHRKGARIMQMSDSSDEEKENNKDEVCEPEISEEEPSTEIVENKDSVIEPVIEGKRGRAKVKQSVTRSYYDEEGYLVTKKESVMVSCSEDEEEVRKPSPKKEESNVAPKAKKQGSIMNFLKKKT